MKQAHRSRNQGAIQILATALVGIMLLSVVAGSGVAVSTGGEPTQSSVGETGVTDVSTQSTAPESLSIPGRSYASASDPGSAGTDLSGEFTMEFWLRYNESSDEDAVIMTKGGIPGSHAGNYQVRLDGTGDARNIRFAFNDFAGNTISNSEIPAGEWTHVALSYDGSTRTLYINGEQDAQDSNGSPETNNADFTVGADDSQSGHFLDGRVDDIRLWGDSRNLIEIQDNMFADLDGTEQGLNALYQFDGAGLNDQVGDSNLTAGGSAKLVEPDANLGDSPPPFLHTTPQNDSVVLNWTARTAGPNTASADSYRIYRSTSPSFTSSSSNLVATVSGSESSYVDVDVSAGTTYYYQIRAGDAEGNYAGYSKAAVARPYVERGGGSLDFDGRGYGTVSDRPSVELGKRGAFAVEFWLKYNASSDEDAVVMTKGGIPGQTRGSYRVTLDGDGEARTITFAFNDFAGSLTSSDEIQAGQWTHVAFTYDGTTQTLYVNGQQEGQRDDGTAERNSDPLHIGVDSSESGHFLNGSIDDIRLWDTHRTRSDIVDNYRNRLTGDEPGLLNYWRFNEIGSMDTIRSSETKKSSLSLSGDAEIEAGGAYPVAPYVFATSENRASNVTFENRMSSSLDKIHYQFTSGDAPTPGGQGGGFYRSTWQPSEFKPQHVTGLTDNVTYYHYLQSEVDGQRSDFQRPATATPYSERGGASLSLSDGSYGTASDRPTLDINSEFSIEFWVKYDASSDEDAVVLSKGGTPGDSNGNYMAYLVGTGEDRPIYFSFNDFFNNLESNGGIPAGEWTHVAFTNDGSTQSLYINGELDAQNGDDGSPQGVSAPLRIGTDQPATGHYLEGNVDNLRIWEDSRTDQEIKNNYVNGLIGNESGLEHYWRFDDTNLSDSRGSADWHATIESRDGATLSKPGVLPVPPRVYARGGTGEAEAVWRVRNRPDDVFLYRSSQRDRSDRSLQTVVDADQQSVYVDDNLSVNETVFYEATSETADGQESDYSFPASALPSTYVAGNAFEFNGDSSHMTVEDRPALDIDSDFSISFWVKFNESSDEDAVIFSKGGTPGDSANYMAYLVDSGENRSIYFQFNNFFNGVWSNGEITAGEWTHVAFTHDGNTRSLYIDGELDTQNNDDGSPQGNSAPLQIGTDQAETGHYLDGQVDELRISDPGRTKAEIQATYDRELIGDEAGLEGYWRGCYQPNDDSVWGHARRPMTATFTDITCAPSTAGLQEGSLTSTFDVTLDGGTNGLNLYEIGLETGADTAIRGVDPGIINGSRFDVIEGGPGEKNVTALGSEEIGIVEPSNETRTLFSVEYSGNVTADEISLDVIELDDDDYNPIPESAVSLSKAEPENSPPNATVTIDDTTPAPGQSVAFSASASNDTDGQIVSYEWDFDDGSTATGENATHTFSSLGTYNVTLTVTDSGGATSSETVTVTVQEPGPTVALEPAEQEVSTGGTEVYDLVIRGADNGVASYQFDLASSNTSVAALTNVSLVGTDLGAPLTNVTVAGDGSSLSVTVGTASIAATGNVTIATVSVDVGVAGTATLSPLNVSVGDTAGASYRIDSVDDATIEALDRAPALVGGRPAQNLDGDDTYEDTNGDGTFNIVDVNALFQNRNSQTVQENAADFDFNGDGSFNIVDVNALFQRVLG